MNKYRSNFSLILAIVLLSSCDFHTKELSENQISDSNVALKRIFKDKLSVSGINNKYEISYCPDNTCDIFEITHQYSKQILYDFVYMYFYYLSDYNYPAVLEFRNTQSAAEVHQILEKYSKNCDSSVQNKKCIFLSLQKKYNIRLKFVRYDENKRNEVPVSLEEILQNSERGKKLDAQNSPK